MKWIKKDRSFVNLEQISFINLRDDKHLIKHSEVYSIDFYSSNSNYITSFEFDTEEERKKYLNKLENILDFYLKQ